MKPRVKDRLKEKDRAVANAKWDPIKSMNLYRIVHKILHSLEEGQEVGNLDRHKKWRMYLIVEVWKRVPSWMRLVENRAMLMKMGSIPWWHFRTCRVKERVQRPHRNWVKKIESLKSTFRGKNQVRKHHFCKPVPNLSKIQRHSEHLCRHLIWEHLSQTSKSQPSPLPKRTF